MREIVLADVEGEVGRIGLVSYWQERQQVLRGRRVAIALLRGLSTGVVLLVLLGSRKGDVFLFKFRCVLME